MKFNAGLAREILQIMRQNSENPVDLGSWDDCFAAFIVRHFGYTPKSGGVYTSDGSPLHCLVSQMAVQYLGGDPENLSITCSSCLRFPGWNHVDDDCSFGGCDPTPEDEVYNLFLMYSMEEIADKVEVLAERYP